MKRKTDKVMKAFREGRIDVDEYRRYYNLKAILSGISYYQEFEKLNQKIFAK